MEDKTNLARMNFILGVGFTLVIIAAILIAFSYFKNISNACTSNPFVYGARELEEQTGAKVYGSIGFIGDPMVSYPTLTFTSTNISS